MRNIMDSLVDCVVMPIKDNLNDKYDKLYFKILKIILNILAFNLFALKINAYKVLFENLSKIYSTARGATCKALAKNVMVKLFDILLQRLKLQNLFTTSSNPTSFFYSANTRATIQSETDLALRAAFDKVSLLTDFKDLSDESSVITELDKDRLMALPSINFVASQPQRASFAHNGEESSELKETKADEEKEDALDATREPMSDKGSYLGSDEDRPAVFGWCYVCHKPAPYFCKERRLPICSYECKMKYAEMSEKYQKQIQFSRQNEKEEMSIGITYLELFALLSEKCFDKKYEKERSCYLDILLTIVRSPSPTLRRDSRFIKFLKQEVFPNILKIALVNEDQVLKISLIIFLNLVLNFRKYLRNEIGIFIQEVFMEILESSNSKFVVKYYILQVLTTLIEEKTIPFELFLNYDCREDSVNICERVIDLLVKISQGKYSKNIYAGLINGVEEEELKKEASHAIVNLIRGSAALLEHNNTTTEEVSKGITEVLHKKRLIDDAMIKFNSGKRGSLKMLQELGVIKGESPEALAEFLRTDKRVSAGIIGELFGNEEDFYLKVLDSYLNSMNFVGQDILQALKHFMTLFEMPGEGQKVERILENFGLKYANDNPDHYIPDGAHMICFLLVMLHTNVYNPNVADKMTLAQFISIGKDIKNDDKTISVETLTRFYTEILAQPLAVHTLEKRRKDIQNTLSRSYKEKQELFKLESAKMFENYASKIRDNELESDYQFVENASVLQVFLQTTWTSLLAFFSTTIANCEDMEYLRSLVDSTMSMIRLCDNFSMQTERDSFISLLVQFSGLEKTFNKLLDEKNLLFMQAVLSIATKMGNHLHTGWKFVLNCIISLNFYQSQADRIKPNLNPQISPLALTADEQNSLFVANYFTNDDLNRIFTDSKKLDDHSILDFISGLCSLSIKELEKGESRAYYILEQIVVVAHFNIYRNPLEWLRIWDLIDKLYEEIMTRNSLAKRGIIEFSIDILRQLVLCCFEVR